jgi:hypothetical protein
MMDWLQDFAIRASRTWWLYLLVVAVMAGSLVALINIGEAFPAHAAGAQPLDLQNALTAAEVYPQLAGYTDRARELYGLFAAVDVVFPFSAGLFIAATTAFALRHGIPSWYEALARRKLLLLPMVGSAFDWLENLTILTALGLMPTEIQGLAGLLVLAKRCKLAFTLLAQGAMVLLLLVALGRWLLRRAGGTGRASA